MKEKVIERLEPSLVMFAKIWLKETGRESLTETMQGFDFVSDSYRYLTAEEKAIISETEFLDLLQKKVAELF